MIYRFNIITIIIKILTSFFAENDRLILILIWIFKGPRITKRKLEDACFFNFGTYYKATVKKTVYYWHERKYREWNRGSNPEINPHIRGQLIFKRVLRQFIGGKNSLLLNCSETTSYLCTKEWTWTPTSHYVQNQRKIDQRSQYRSWTYKALRRKYRYKSLWLWIRQCFFRYNNTKSTSNQRKSR